MADQIYIPGFGIADPTFVTAVDEVLAESKVAFDSNMALLYAAFLEDADITTLQSAFDTVTDYQADQALFLQELSDFASQDAVFGGVLNNFIDKLTDFNQAQADYQTRFAAWDFGRGAGPHPGNPPIPPKAPEILVEYNPALAAWNANLDPNQPGNYLTIRKDFIDEVEATFRLISKQEKFQQDLTTYQTALINYNTAFAAWDFGAGTGSRPGNLPIPPRAPDLLVAEFPGLATYNTNLDTFLVNRAIYLDAVNDRIRNPALPNPVAPTITLPTLGTIVEPTIPQVGVTTPSTNPASYSAPTPPVGPPTEPDATTMAQYREYNSLVEAISNIIRTLRTSFSGNQVVLGDYPIFDPDVGNTAPNVFHTLQELFDEALSLSGETSFEDAAQLAMLNLSNLARSDQLDAAMATSAGTMIATWNAVDINDTAGTLLDKLIGWRDVPKVRNFIIEGIGAGKRADIAFLTPTNLQDLIRLEYVQRGNQIISRELVELEDALDATQDVLDTITQIQEIMNMKVPERLADEIVELPDFWDFIFDRDGQYLLEIADQEGVGTPNLGSNSPAGLYATTGTRDSALAAGFRLASSPPTPPAGQTSEYLLQLFDTAPLGHEGWIWNIAFIAATNNFDTDQLTLFEEYVPMFVRHSNGGGLQPNFDADGGRASRLPIEVPFVNTAGDAQRKGIIPRPEFFEAIGLPQYATFTPQTSWTGYWNAIYGVFESENQRANVNTAALWEMFASKPLVTQYVLANITPTTLRDFVDDVVRGEGYDVADGARDGGIVRLHLPGDGFAGLEKANRGDYLNAWQQKLEQLEALRFESEIDGIFDPTPNDPNTDATDAGIVDDVVNRWDSLYARLEGLRDRYLDLLDIEFPANFEFDPDIPFEPVNPANPTEEEIAFQAADQAIRDNNILFTIFEFLPLLDPDREYGIDENNMPFDLYTRVPTDDASNLDDFIIPPPANDADRLRFLVEDRQLIQVVRDNGGQIVDQIVRERGGRNQEVLSRLVSASQNFNDVRRQELRSVMFRFEEFYKSASSLIAKITQLLESIARNAGR